jgi:protein SCO1/2
MRRALFLFLPILLFATGCSEHAGWHATDITGAMPTLALSMTRANDGKPVTAKDYRGKITLLYFGYTHCPDICPTTLANLSDMLQQLGSRADGVRILFVTVDPARDTDAVMHDYVKAFAPQIDGLRGSDDALVALARRYRVAYGVTPASGKNPYTVMHSDAVFFFDNSGHARLVATSTDDTRGITSDVRRLLDGS